MYTSSFIIEYIHFIVVIKFILEYIHFMNIINDHMRTCKLTIRVDLLELIQA